MKIFSLFFLLFVCAISAQAQLNLTVDTTVDDATLTACTAEAGDCSLRGAISNANGTIAADTIDFAIPAAICASGVCTIASTSGFLQIDNAATAGALTIINSTGASNLLISGGDVSTVFLVRSGANLTLNGVTVTNGFSVQGSGGIASNGTLTLTNSIVSGNTGRSAGGIGNGGGTLMLTNSIVSGNTAEDGGGIYNFSGTATLLNSTVSGNTETGNEDGGGIINAGTMSLTNSTVSGNTSTDGRGGGILNRGTLNLTSVTVAFNGAASGGGVFNTGTANLFNTIVANNTSAGTAPDFSGAISPASSFNLIGNGAGMTGMTNGTNGNQVGTAANPIDPKLGSLALNGGTTLNHALLPGSPAIDQGDASGTDQRGLTRPVDDPAITDATGGNGADIGAFEVQTANVLPTTIEQCKNGGWLTFTMPRTFSNQGDCVQFVNTGN
jgi:hypothetical protein